MQLHPNPSLKIIIIPFFSLVPLLLLFSLDQIAIPDFSSGAMEHWGLITYRETYLLYDPNQVSVKDKHAVAMVVAHELAHNVRYLGLTNI